MKTISTGGGYGHKPQNFQSEQSNIHTTKSKKFTPNDISTVRILIEKCLQKYMNKDEVVETLFLNSNLIHPAFTAQGVISLNVTVETILQRLEEQNPNFFRGYYIRMKLRKQIMLFNQLLEQQRCMMNVHLPAEVPYAPMQNEIHPMPVNNLPMGEEHSIPAAGQPHLVSMNNSGISNCHVDNGNVMVMNHSAPHMASGIPPSSAMPSLSEMPVSPASGGHFPFIRSDRSGMGNASAFDASAGLLPAPDNATAIPGSLDQDQVTWDFNLSEGLLNSVDMQSDFDMLMMESSDQYALGDDFLNLYPQGSQFDKEMS